MVQSLIVLFQGCLQEQWTPQEWNKERVQLLHKKGNRNDLNNYRGIALTDVIGKIFAKILTDRIMIQAEELQIIPEAQAGFRKNRGIDDHIFVLEAIISTAKKNHSPLIIAFLDIQKAYNNVNRQLLWKILEIIGIEQSFINVLKCLYKETERVVVWSNNSTRPFPNVKGLRQGCPLSPILFNLYVLDIPGLLEKNLKGIKMGKAKISALMYADDIAIIAESRDEMRKALRIIEDTLEHRNLKLNKKKSKVLRIGPGSTIPTTWSPDNKSGEESAIEEVSEYKYLGVWFGKGRQHSKHMKQIKRKMSYIVPSIISRAQNAPNCQMAAKAL